MLRMDIRAALKPVTRENLARLTRAELLDFALGEQDIRQQFETRLALKEEEFLCLGDRYLRLKNKAFIPSSERQPRSKKIKKKLSKLASDRTLKPSERYPNAAVIDQDVELSPPPGCDHCGCEMIDSGMTEVTESLSVIPKQYLIKRQHLHKYCCKNCHGGIVTTPSPPRIKSGSSYDDELIIDVSLSKYCDLIPIERYCKMAARQGFPGLPPHSMIELTHYLADFLTPVYELIRKEVQSSRVLHADETPHKMLEGSHTANWYLWGFSNMEASYFECHGTRSGDVAWKFLQDSKCQYLMSDVFSGYSKAVRLANEGRAKEKISPITAVYCNVHARRKLREIPGEDGDFFVDRYAEIYRIEAESKVLSLQNRTTSRQSIRPIFEQMKVKAIELKDSYSTKSDPYRYLNYLLNNYEGLTRCLDDPDIPLDNNHEERQLRNPVIGRKTWYGTHSKRGALTAQILFSIVESCKLNNINPREYIQKVVRAIHQNLPAFTPADFSKK